MNFQGFAEYYKSISDMELMAILDNQGDYEPIAVEAAIAELTKRNLGDEEINAARARNLELEMHRLKQNEKIDKIKIKFTTRIEGIFETINPIQKEISNTERTIRIIIIVFCIFFILRTIANFGWLILYIRWLLFYPITSPIVIFQWVMVPISIYFFWKRTRIGWILLSVYLLFNGVGDLVLIAPSLGWAIQRADPFYGLFDSPFARSYMYQIFFFGSTFYMLLKNEMREAYSINKETMWKTIIFTSVLTLLFYIIIVKDSHHF